MEITFWKALIIAFQKMYHLPDFAEVRISIVFSSYVTVMS